MATLGPSTDYTDKDFDALIVRTRNLIRSAFPEWTDEDAANFGNISIEMFCFVVDVLTKYQDNQAAEAFIGRTTQRKNILALCKMIGFTARGSTASLVDLEVSVVNGPPVGTVTIADRTRARTDAITSPAVFETVGSAVIPAGSSVPIVVSAENAEQKSELFASNGKPNFEFRLAYSPFLDGSLVITAGNGAYDVVSDFLDSGSGDRHCTVTTDQNDRATVRFGNGINGAIPIGTGNAVYRIGGGSSGRIEAGAVRRLEGSFFDSLGNPVTLAVTNPAPSSQALDRMSVEEIRGAGPRSLRVLTRTVAREDYEINAMKVPGVARALMLTSDQDGAIAENTGALFVVPDGGGTPSQLVKDAVLEIVTVTYPNTLTFETVVYDGVYLVVNVAATLWIRQGYAPTTVRKNVNDALVAAFAINRDEDPGSTQLDGIDFGFNLRDADGNMTGSIAWSDVFNIVRDAAGVLKVAPNGLLLNGAANDLTIEARQFPILGTVTLINGATNTPF